MPVIEINGSLIAKQIADNATDATLLAAMYDEYKGEVAITSREKTDDDDICNQLANDFYGEIVDQSVGYVFGNPIAYQVSKESYGDDVLVGINQRIKDWGVRNNVDLLDSETGKFMGICGKASRLLYVDPSGEERAINIQPWKTIFIRDANGDVVLGIYYYTTQDLVTGKETGKAEVYDSQMVTFYIKAGEGYQEDQEKEARPHMFDYVPLIEFKNNAEKLSDVVKVESLIDGYDRAISMAQDELEEHRMAYMKFKGVTIDTEEYAKMKEKGGILLPEDGDVDYLTKEINDEFLENHKKTLRENIYRFSKTVDMSDENFSGGQQSGESRKWKLLALTQKAIMKEREFTAGLRMMFKVLCSAWSKKGIALRWEDLSFKFTRCLPIEIKASAEIMQLLFDKVPLHIIYALMPFIENAEEAVLQWEEEQAGLPDEDDDEKKMKDDDEE